MSNNKKLIRDPQQLPQWFPLTLYSSKMGALDWLEAILTRMVVQTQYQTTGDVELAVESFERLVINRDGEPRLGRKLLDQTSPARDLWGVQEPTAFEVAYMSLMLGNSHKGRVLQERLAELRRNKDHRALLIEPPKDIVRSKKQVWVELVNRSREPFQMQDVLRGLPIFVDVDQDDESLERAFRLWLYSVRAVRGPAPKPLGSKEFTAWQDYGILPYFDLTFWGELHGVRYSETIVADALWPQAEEFDGADRLRKVTRAKTAQVFHDWGIANRLRIQLDLAEALRRDLKEGDAQSESITEDD